MARFGLLWAFIIAALFLMPVRNVRASAELPSLETMIGQMIMVGFRGTGEQPLSHDIKTLLMDISQGKVGGVILFEKDFLTRSTRNIKSQSQVAALITLLQGSATIPLFIGIDQEGGKVRRLLPAHGAPDTPSARKMGEKAEEDTYTHAKRLGNFLAQLGINVNFAPVVDVDVYSESPAIGQFERAFSENANKVGAHAAAFAKGMADAGVIYSYKHFPGHGSAKTDSHAGFTDITDTWEQQELEPYRQLAVNGMPGMIMVGHMYHKLLDSRHPASLSAPTINGLLRKELNWQGVTITDDMQMNAILQNYSKSDAVYLAINAGVDIILYGNNIQYDPEEGRQLFAIILELVQSGKISKNRIAESYQRIMILKKNAGLYPQ